MAKQKILLLIPLLIIAGFLIYTWVIILTTDVEAVIQHYVAAIIFLELIFLFFTSFKKVVMATCIFLLAGTFNLLSLTPSIMSDSFGIIIGGVKVGTPQFQLISFGILVLFTILNFDTLVNLSLDFKEEIAAKKLEKLNRKK